MDSERTMIPWVLVISDGVTIRTIHPPALPAQAQAIIARILEEHLNPPVDPITKPPPPPVDSTDVSRARTLARTQGFSGDVCGKCGMYSMKRTGTCLTCQNCANTSGGCD